MKSLIAIATLLSGLSAQAAVTQIGSVYFQAASAWVPATELCRAGAMIVKKDGTGVQARYFDNSADSDKTGYVVIKEAKQPVISVAKRCVEVAPDSSKQSCLAFETYTLDQSSVNIVSFKDKKHFEDARGGNIIGKYTIPACVK